MIPVLSVSAMRRSDAQTIAGGVPSRDLMYRAGEAIFRAIPRRAPVAIACGSGNNAGDGYVLASFLQQSGIPCTLFLLEDRFSADGAFYFGKCREQKIPVEYFDENTSFAPFATVVDCLFGTGFHGRAEGLYARAIDAINQSGAFVVSVDINSGLNGDNGCGTPCVISDLTVSVGSFQPGHYLNRAKDVMKAKINCDIGIAPCEKPYGLMERADAAACFPTRKNDANKGSYGYAALLGGSLAYSGAIRLASMANAAMRAGCGVVRIGAPRSLCPLLVPQILESTLSPLSDRDGQYQFDEAELAALTAKCRAIAVGMGFGCTEETKRAVLWLMQNYSGTLIVDADGINALAECGDAVWISRKAPLLLTPHLGEFARLSKTDIAAVREAPIPHAQAFAKAHHAVVLLKGPTTVVTDGSDTILVDRGCGGMATAGSGDVLSGILAAVCAANDNLLLAAAAGAYVNGLAGEIAEEKVGSVSMLAGDTVSAISQAIREIRG